ncbi:hypothetical protein ACNI65_03490 [Roseateles sp. So40a]|uniref:hypothetical protein n=1 Tax=Roseateles sp. So40a TaxID=3400226 RepID=UPI003A88E428
MRASDDAYIRGGWKNVSWSNGTCILHLCRKSSRIESIVGILADRPRKRKKPLSLKQMKKAIEDGWSGKRR